MAEADMGRRRGDQGPCRLRSLNKEIKKMIDDNVWELRAALGIEYGM